VSGSFGAGLEKTDMRSLGPGLELQRADVRVVRHESPNLRFEIAFARPHEALRTYVREYVGWCDRSAAGASRRQLPSGLVPLIINFDSSIRERKASAGQWRTYQTFIAGLHDQYTLVEAAAAGEGLQVNFTPIGARLFFARPNIELTNRTEALGDVLGKSGEELTSRLYEASSWDQRFDILDREVAHRIARARQPAPRVVHAWSRLVNAAGDIRIRELAIRSAWSGRHFTQQFRQEIGLAPKAFARVLRFRRAVRLLTAATREGSLAAVAQQCGYFDQAHLARDFHALAGVAPSALLANCLPQGAGFRSGDR
jgi:AraC-like DNA-binding protein